MNDSGEKMEHIVREGLIFRKKQDYCSRKLRKNIETDH